MGNNSFSASLGTGEVSLQIQSSHANESKQQLFLNHRASHHLSRQFQLGTIAFANLELSLLPRFFSPRFSFAGFGVLPVRGARRLPAVVRSCTVPCAECCVLSATLVGVRDDTRARFLLLLRPAGAQGLSAKEVVVTAGLRGSATGVGSALGKLFREGFVQVAGKRSSRRWRLSPEGHTWLGRWLLAAWQDHTPR